MREIISYVIANMEENVESIDKTLFEDEDKKTIDFDLNEDFKDECPGLKVVNTQRKFFLLREYLQGKVQKLIDKNRYFPVNDFQKIWIMVMKTLHLKTFEVTWK